MAVPAAEYHYFSRADGCQEHVGSICEDFTWNYNLKPANLSADIQALNAVGPTTLRVAAEYVYFASQTTATMCISRSLEIWSSGPDIIFDVVLLNAIVKLSLVFGI